MRLDLDEGRRGAREGVTEDNKTLKGTLAMWPECGSHRACGEDVGGDDGTYYSGFILSALEVQRRR